MKLFDDLPDLFYLGFYCPKDDENFNEYSHSILELKDKEERAINSFLQKFRDVLSNEDIAIVTVPPHTSTNPSSGIRELAIQLIQLYPKFTNLVFCLERFKDSVRDRNIENHLKSIRVSNQSLIKDKKVILIDDVLTTGSSIVACSKLLVDSGVKSIKVIVLGKTIRNIEDAHYFIEQNKDEYIQETIDELNSKHYLTMQSYEIHEDLLKEEKFNEHIAVEKWTNKQNDYFEMDDEEHYYMEEESRQRHEAINTLYNNLLLEIDIKQSEEDSSFPHELYIAIDYCQHYVNEAHQVLDGLTCFSVDNPLVFYFKDW